MRLTGKYFPPVPVPVSTNQIATATNQTPTAGTNPAEQTAGVQPSATAASSNSQSKFVVHPEIPEQLLVLSNADANYTFTSRGGGLSQVELLHYPETVSSHRTKEQINRDLATLNSTSGPPVLAILADESLQGDGVFKLIPTNGGLRAEKTLTNGLTLVKDYQLGTNYLVYATVRIENHSPRAVAIPAHELAIGTATPMGPQDNGVGQSVMWFDGVRAIPVNLTYFNTNTTTLFVFPRTPRTEYRAGSNDVVWASVQNQYFALATMLATNELPAASTNAAPANPSASNTNRPALEVVVHMVDLPPPSQEEIDANPRTVRAPKGLQAALVYPGAKLEPGQALEDQFTLFAGPKKFGTLASIGDRFNNNIDHLMSFNGFFGWFARALLGAMNWMHNHLALPYGWAIVAITVIIKLIFWPLTQYSTKSMKRMQALQPQLKALQEKYKDDPQKFSQKQIEFWRKNKVNPLSGCLPMLLQLPVLWGFYRMLQNAIELRGAPFLWVADLSKPDTIFVLPGFNFPVNPLPLLMGATMLWQSHLTPPSPGMDPAQQKMMRYMPLIFLVFLYNFSSGLALYWTVQNLLSILQTKLIRTQIDPVGTPKAPVPVPVAPQKKKK